MHPSSTSDSLFSDDVSNKEHKPLPVGKMVTSYSDSIMSIFSLDISFAGSLVPPPKSMSSRPSYASFILVNDFEPVLLSLSSLSSSFLFSPLEIDSLMFSEELLFSTFLNSKSFFSDDVSNGEFSPFLD